MNVCLKKSAQVEENLSWDNKAKRFHEKREWVSQDRTNKVKRVELKSFKSATRLQLLETQHLNWIRRLYTVILNWKIARPIKYPESKTVLVFNQCIFSLWNLLLRWYKKCCNKNVWILKQNFLIKSFIQIQQFIMS